MLQHILCDFGQPGPNILQWRALERPCQELPVKHAWASHSIAVLLPGTLI
jgi:hypothetical protein